MPTLTNPTMSQMTAAVAAEAAFANKQRGSKNRLLTAEQVSAAVLAVTMRPAGAFDCHGGTAASAYPASTSTLAVAWYTDLQGNKLVRIRTGIAQLKDADACPLAPYNAHHMAEGLIAAGAWPALTSDVLLKGIELLRDEGTYPAPVCRRAYDEPGDLRAWVELADEMDAAVATLEDADADRVRVTTEAVRKAVGVK